MMASPIELLEVAQAWCDSDPDPHTREELSELIAQAREGNEVAFATVADQFSTRLQFGTAGLRGALGPGPNRMNRIVVQQAAAGLARYLDSAGAVVIGYDARHNSDTFARDSAAIFSGYGLPTMVLPEPLPTPVLAFAIRHLGAAAGVMVTASHNPPRDNGYKVYLGDGCQIVPPADAAISAQISQVARLQLSELPRADSWITVNDDVVDAYIQCAAALIPSTAPRDISIVYTPMHGVGGVLTQKVFAAAGFPALTEVTEQFRPDPQFPTVDFPNPEEPGAMDLALALAESRDADLVIAHDPDADRCAVGVRDGEWRMLQGDEVGSLLGWWITQRSDHVGVMAQSLVSGSMLEVIARDHGFTYQRTLTGFKWIGRIADLVYGYEEALGYCVDPAHVSDKDGITAALLIAELAAWCKSQDRTLLNVLEDLAERYGVYATRQVSVRVSQLDALVSTMEQLRTHPPSMIGGLVVTQMTDLAKGAWGLPPTDGLYFDLSDGARVIIRPSGTEPKVKAYLQVVTPVDGDLHAARQRADAALDHVQSDVLGWMT
jgi:phosphomannomutase